MSSKEVNEALKEYTNNVNRAVADLQDKLNKVNQETLDKFKEPEYRRYQEIRQLLDGKYSRDLEDSKSKIRDKIMKEVTELYQLVAPSTNSEVEADFDCNIIETILVKQLQ